MISFTRMKQSPLFLTVAGLVLLGAGCIGNAPSTAQVDSPSAAPAAVAPAAPSAVRLDLSGTGLTKVPAYVFDRTELEELDLSDNSLTGALPAEIRHLQRLRVLDASGNRMTGVPAEIGQLSALQDLDLSENELTGLPLELGNLQNLRRLDLRGNAVSQQDLAAIRARLKDTEIIE